MARIVLPVVLCLFSLMALAGSPGEFQGAPPLPEGYADRICDTPQNLTGSVEIALDWGGSVSSIAWDGSAYGVAYVDFSILSYCRIAADGTVLSGPRTISSGSSLGSPSLAWNGTNFGLAWHDSRYGTPDIFFQLITKEGDRLLPTDLHVMTNSANNQNPSLAWNGEEFGLAWEDNFPGNNEIFFQRITSGGAEIGAELRVTSEAASSIEPSLSATGSAYFGLVWQDSRTTGWDLYFCLVSSFGKDTGDIQITSDAANSFWPSLAWGGTQFGVAWTDSRAGHNDLYFTRVSVAGAKLGGDVAVVTGTSTASAPSLAWSGSEFGVTYEETKDGDYEIYFARVTSAGVPTGTALRLTSDGRNSYQPSVAFGSVGYGVSYRGAGGGVILDEVYYVGLGCHADSTPPSCPASPAEISRTPSSLTLGWGAAADRETELARYEIFRDGVSVGTTSAVLWTDVSFNPASGHLYWVDAFNARGWSSSPCDSVDTSDAVPPTCPENLLASGVTQTSARLDWLPAQDAKSGLKQYKVYRNDLFLANVAAGTTTYTDGTLSSNTPYNFAVRAEDYAGNYSATCTTASVYVSTAPITLFVTKNADRTNADLDWNDVYLNEYVVYRSTSPQSASELKRVPVDQTQDPVLQDGVGLWFYYIQQRE